jgi:hypothetical protein
VVETGGLENVPTYLVLPIFSRLAFAQSACVGTFRHIRQRVCNRVCNRSTGGVFRCPRLPRIEPLSPCCQRRLVVVSEIPLIVHRKRVSFVQVFPWRPRTTFVATLVFPLRKGRFWPGRLPGKDLSRLWTISRWVGYTFALLSHLLPELSSSCCLMYRQARYGHVLWYKRANPTKAWA